MNNFISKAFSLIFEWGHILVFIFLGSMLYESNFNENTFYIVLATLFFYILIVGLLTTFVSISDTLLRIEKKLTGTNEVEKNINKNIKTISEDQKSMLDDHFKKNNEKEKK